MLSYEQENLILVLYLVEGDLADMTFLEISEALNRIGTPS